MSTYKELIGKKIKVVSSDPSDSAEGQMWYNTTTGSLRGLAIVEAFSSGANTINSKQRVGGCGTQNAGLACGGLSAPPDPPGLATTEEYNGTGWTAAANLNTARGNTALIGTQTAAVFSGKGSPGTPYAGTTELYNGTAWTTNPNSAPDTYNYRSSCGAQDAGLLAGGNYPPTNRAAGVEHFDGTSFSEGGDLPQKQASQGQAGTQTAAINSFGATNNPVPGNSGDGTNAISLEYDGSSWTAGPNGNGVVPLSGYDMGAGTQTDALFVGGPPVNSCKYDGTTFTVGPALATAQPASAHGSASASATWVAHGSPIPSVGNKSTEFNRSTSTVTAAAWASGNNLNTSRREIFTGTIGTQTSGLAAGGATGPSGKSNATEEYNGSSWTTVNTVPVSLSSRGGAGTQTAGLLFGGNPNPTSVVTTTEYDGTNYSSGGDLNSARGYGPIAAGTLTAALAAGGHNGSSTVTTTEFYNGTAWTAQPNASPSVYTAASGGTQGAAWFAGGLPASTEGYNWDGTSWAAGANFIYGPADNVFGGGPQTAGWLCGGNAPSVTTTTNHYDGTSFFTAPNMGTARYGYGQAGDSSLGLIFGGAPGPGSAITNATEEFTGETTAANVETFSTS